LIQPVPLRVFDSWAEKHPQFPHSLEFCDSKLIVCIMKLPHDGVAAYITREIILTLERMCPGQDCEVWFHTGRIVP